MRRLGHGGYVSDLGEWGPIMHGGAWLTIDGTEIDVLFRDLERVESWLEDARRGRFQVLAQNGYVAGAPPYLPVGELAVCRVLSGRLPVRPIRPRSPRRRPSSGTGALRCRSCSPSGDG